eukprot:2630992-Rhodomonas_salina.1
MTTISTMSIAPGSEGTPSEATLDASGNAKSMESSAVKGDAPPRSCTGVSTSGGESGPLAPPIPSSGAGRSIFVGCKRYGSGRCPGDGGNRSPLPSKVAPSSGRNSSNPSPEMCRLAKSAALGRGFAREETRV